MTEAAALKEILEFANKAELHAQSVALVLGQSIGQEAANARVLERLSIILQDMIDGGRPDDMAEVLKPHAT
jgi:hypothetical protein